MADEIWVLTERVQWEEIIKKSRFYCQAVFVQHESEAFAFLQQIAQEPATHHCWAYKIGTHYRFSDDGEPGGTAGRPILQAIEGAQCDRIMVVVSRWFGGVKLGTGGLIRAYGGVTAKALHIAKKQKWEQRRSFQVSCPFAEIARLQDYLVREDIIVEEEQYSGDGVRWKVGIIPHQVDAVDQKIRDMTRGKVSLVPLEK